MLATFSPRKQREDTAACISYIHWWASEFFPYRLDLVEELRRIIADLAAVRRTGFLLWKYHWIGEAFWVGLGPPSTASVA